MGALVSSTKPTASAILSRKLRAGGVYNTLIEALLHSLEPGETESENENSQNSNDCEDRRMTEV